MKDLDSLLFGLLVDRFRAKPCDVEKLIGENIAINMGGKSDLLGHIKRANGTTIHFETIKHPFQDETAYSGDEGELEVICIGDTIAYAFENIGAEMSTRAVKIFDRIPDRILVKNDRVVEVSYHKSDPDLSELLCRIKDDVGDVASVGDLVRLNNSIKDSITFVDPKERGSYSETEIPLGRVITEYGSVCRHKVGAEFAYLLLEGVESDIRGSISPVEGEVHSFLYSLVEGDEMLVDPINGFVFPVSIAKAEIDKTATSVYHFPSVPLQIVFDYLSR